MDIARAKKLSLILAIVLLLICYAIYAFYVPPNMDEAIHMYIIACKHYQNAQYNTFREACDGSSDLILFNQWRLPIRSYLYAGSLASILYYPLFLVWPSYHSYQVLYLLFFILSALLMSKLVRIPFGVTLLLSAISFPLLYQFIHDTGPIFFHIFVFLLTPYLLGKMERASRPQRVGLIIMAGLSIFLAIEQKPFFLILLPLFCLFTCWILYYRGELSLAAIRRFVIVLALAAIPSAVLLFATVPTGGSYIQYMANFGADSADRISSAKRIITLMLSLNNFADRIYVNRPRFLTGGLAVMLLSVSYWIWCALMLKRYVTAHGSDNRKRLRLSLSLIGIVVIVLALFVAQGNVRFGHHLIFVYLLLHILLLIVMRHLLYTNRKMFWTATVILIAFNAAFFSVNLFAGIHPFSSRDRLTALRTVLTEQREEQSITVHLSWGLYYIDALYGSPDQTVIFIFNLHFPDEIEDSISKSAAERESFEELMLLAQRLKKDIVFVYHGAEAAVDKSVPATTVRNLMGFLSERDLQPLTPLHQGRGEGGWNVDLLPYENIVGGTDL